MKTRTAKTSTATKRKGKGLPADAEPIDPEAQGGVHTNELRFAGQALRPLNVLRHAAAQILGLKFGALTDEETARANAGGGYDGMLRDAIIVTFLCASPDSVALKAFRAPERVLAEAMNWVEKYKGKGADGYNELFAAFMEIMAGLEGEE